MLKFQNIILRTINTTTTLTSIYVYGDSRQMIEKLKCNWQYAFPGHFFSRMIAKLAETKVPFIKNSLIKLFIASYKVDINSALLTQLGDYPSFNDFFIRELKKGARVIAEDKNIITSPADGTVSESGQIKQGKLMQAKGQQYSLSKLVSDDNRDKPFKEGSFITIYLAPHDYHRVHMPIDGKLLETIYVPGQIFSVNNRSVAGIPDLFCRNERLICFFDTSIGQVALILVGAMLVAGIDTVWSGAECPCPSRSIVVKNYRHKEITLKKGEEMGKFKFGSTVILLFPPKQIVLNQFETLQQIKMGAPIGSIITEGATNGRD